MENLNAVIEVEIPVVQASIETIKTVTRRLSDGKYKIFTDEMEGFKPYLMSVKNGENMELKEGSLIFIVRIGGELEKICGPLNLN